MSRNTCYWIVPLILASGVASASVPYNNLLIPQTPWMHGFYIGAFGGGGSASNSKAYQRGTAFFSEVTSIGPLAVDAAGNLSFNSVGFGGFHAGYEFRNQASCFTPAVEFEGFYLRSKLDGSLDAPHTALPEHLFDDTFHLGSYVYLLNAVFNLDIPSCPQAHVYAGGGIGAGLLTMSDADSLQVNPVEAGVNHFGAKKSATTDAFAAQLKLGVSYDITDCFNVFAEYRYLYLASTRFDFGSTVAVGHVPTSPWGINIASMNYNLGAVGIQFKL